jgi:TatD DNase family protein
MIVDTHCHLDDERYNDDIDEVILRAKEQGVERFIIPGADPKTLKRAVELSEVYPEVYFAVGVHPYDAQNYDRSFLKEFVSHPKCVAIGECGLDYFRLPQSEEEIFEEKRLQKRVFIDQIKWAKELGLPLIVHVRDSSDDSFELLEKYTGEMGGVLHCYNASEVLLRLVNKNFYYGIGGVLTFKNAKKLINIYPKIPKSRLLVETDSPYLTPHPYRGKRNEPAYTKNITYKMGEISLVESNEIEEITAINAKKLFTKLN